MSVASAKFIYFILAGLIFFHLCKPAIGRRIILALMNIGFILTYEHRPLFLLPLFLFLLISYLFTFSIRKIPTKALVTSTISALVVIFIVLKKYALIPDALTLNFSYTVLGLSYILFRVIHVIFDSFSNELEAPITPLSFFNYTCSFLTLISGPIQRYEDFYEQTSNIDQVKVPREEIYRSANRIINGLFKVLILSNLFQNLFDYFLKLSSHNALYFSLTCMLYLWEIYFNFSGYMDIVIGAGVFFGFNLPENFNEPFKSKNMLDLWTRWHITLSEWFKMYLFNPLLTFFIRKFPKPSFTPYLGVLTFFFTFFVMGLWHGTTSIFLFYGFFLGFSISANKLFQIFLKERLTKANHSKLQKNIIYRYLCNAFTIGIFSLALTCLWNSMGSLFVLSKQLGVTGILSSVILTSLIHLSVTILLILPQKISDWWALKKESLNKNDYLLPLIFSTKAYLILVIFTALTSNVQKFIYETF
jgi:alginate O-acetyltransferase complex protein AlgI